tara:strand:- start:250 stop:537 length:288 start_codon:yes stop_codon:yes gene_type:complete
MRKNTLKAICFIAFAFIPNTVNASGWVHREKIEPIADMSLTGFLNRGWSVSHLSDYYMILKDQTGKKTILCEFKAISPIGRKGEWSLGSTCFGLK